MPAAASSSRRRPSSTEPATSSRAVARRRPARVAKTPLAAPVSSAQTAIDFWGRRRVWLGISRVLLIVISVVSLSTRGLNLGIDFEGGVAWDVPADSS